MNCVIMNILNSKQLVLLGDLNVKVGAGSSSSLAFEVTKVNVNGQRLLELCFYHSLCVTNTIQTKVKYRMSWWPPRSRYWNQLDLIISMRANLKHILLTRSYQAQTVTRTTLCHSPRQDPSDIKSLH